MEGFPTDDLEIWRIRLFSSVSSTRGKRLEGAAFGAHWHGPRMLPNQVYSVEDELS